MRLSGSLRVTRRLSLRPREYQYSPIKYVIIPYIAVVQTPSQPALLPASQALDRAPAAPAVLRRAGLNALFAADEFFAARISNANYSEYRRRPA